MYVKCPHCHKGVVPYPTKGQVMAFLLTKIHGMTFEEAGITLGCSPSAITGRLRRLAKHCPGLFQPLGLDITKAQRVDKIDESEIVHKF